MPVASKQTECDQMSAGFFAYQLIGPHYFKKITNSFSNSRGGSRISEEGVLAGTLA